MQASPSIYGERREQRRNAQASGDSLRSRKAKARGAEENDPTRVFFRFRLSRDFSRRLSQNLELARRLLRRSFYVVTDFFMYIPFVVDNAYTCDSRIKKFKEDEKERKLAEKKAKEDAARAAAEEKERVSIDTLSEWRSRSQTSELSRGLLGKI